MTAAYVLHMFCVQRSTCATSRMCKICAACTHADRVYAAHVQNMCIVYICRLHSSCTYAKYVYSVHMQTAFKLHICKICVLCTYADYIQAAHMQNYICRLHLSCTYEKKLCIIFRLRIYAKYVYGAL